MGNFFANFWGQQDFKNVLIKNGLYLWRKSGHFQQILLHTAQVAALDSGVWRSHLADDDFLNAHKEWRKDLCVQSWGVRKNTSFNHKSLQVKKSILKQHMLLKCTYTPLSQVAFNEKDTTGWLYEMSNLQNMSSNHCLKKVETPFSSPL